MKLSIGIVGLPNVGKSTLFNALLKKQVANVANYPFCTIEPNVGIVEVPDGRLPVLAKVVGTQKIVPAAIEFYDIAGLVRGASKGEGLGNQFLAHIREVAVIIHVVRLFEDADVVHVTNEIDPVDDIQTIETELGLADLSTLEKQTQPRGSVAKEEKARFEVIQKLRQELEKGRPARDVTLTDEEAKSVRDLHLLTAKPVLYLFNISEQQLENRGEVERRVHTVLNQTGHPNAISLYLCAKLENEIAGFSDAEQQEFLTQYRLEEPGLNRLIKKAYRILGLISFLTAGEKEARAWTITQGTLAPQAAGVIHTDFETHFIRADIIPYEEFVRAGGWAKARELGKVRTVGKDYAVQDGDVVEFKVGV